MLQEIGELFLQLKCKIHEEDTSCTLSQLKKCMGVQDSGAFGSDSPSLCPASGEFANGDSLESDFSRNNSITVRFCDLRS